MPHLLKPAICSLRPVDRPNYHSKRKAGSAEQVAVSFERHKAPDCFSWLSSVQEIGGRRHKVTKVGRWHLLQVAHIWSAVPGHRFGNASDSVRSILRRVSRNELVKRRQGADSKVRASETVRVLDNNLAGPPGQVPGSTSIYHVGQSPGQQVRRRGARESRVYFLERSLEGCRGGFQPLVAQGFGSAIKSSSNLWALEAGLIKASFLAQS